MTDDADLLGLLARYRTAIVELLAIIRRDGGYMPADAQLRLREIERWADADGARIVQPQLDGEQPE